MKISLFILSMLATLTAAADGFRCGTRLVLEGDSVTRLTHACGAPDRTFKSRIRLGRSSAQASTSVTQWLYERRGKRVMVVSVRGGKVVRIERG
jgi:hypothetical protein